MLKTFVILLTTVVFITFIFLSNLKTAQKQTTDTNSFADTVVQNTEETRTEFVKFDEVKNVRAVNKNPDFKNRQKKNARVMDAYNEKEQSIADRLNENNIDIDNLNILITAYKDEQLLDIYAKDNSETSYRKIFSYDICKKSGKPGPKRKQGDEQTPEGFYFLDEFNPVSNYYLSLGVSYPNQSDRIKSKAGNLGGDIFIHGDCKTIGCLPMTNDKIKEIYVLAVQAMQSGQTKIPVYIFPFKMTAENLTRFNDLYKDNNELINFWSNLKSGYDKFEKNLIELSYSIDNKGDYIF